MAIYEHALTEISVEFKDRSNGSYIDPSTVTLYLKAPDQTTETVNDAALDHYAEGRYRLRRTFTPGGRWHAEWDGTGVAVIVRPFDVIPSPVRPG